MSNEIPATQNQLMLRSDPTRIRALANLIIIRPCTALPRQASIFDDPAERWDRASVHAFQGIYGEYLPNKVGKVFTELWQTALGF